MTAFFFTQNRRNATILFRNIHGETVYLGHGIIRRKAKVRIFAEVRVRVKYGACYDTALCEVETPVITCGFGHWDLICSTWKAYLWWKNPRGFPERHEGVRSQSPACTKGIKLLLYL